jgi:EAL domain-containing protein (putative c-di-GMP-specific phosphodiesterase class I)
MFSTPGDDAITLHYQPLLERHGRLSGMEALMRWHHRQRGSISPEAFIPVFEKSGLIGPVSRWALAQACADAVLWPEPMLVAVNLGGIQLVQNDLLSVVRTALAESGLAAERLELEVTEASLIGEVARKASVIAGLRDEGVGVALADFGGQQAALAHLKQLPLSKVKIARELIAQIETSPSARSIIRMTIDFGHSKDLAVAAEGIETQRQLEFLEDHDCDWFQGYLIGMPAPIETHAELIHAAGGRIPKEHSPAAALSQKAGRSATPPSHDPHQSQR